jgi:hypothetical protein
MEYKANDFIGKKYTMVLIIFSIICEIAGSLIFKEFLLCK